MKVVICGAGQVGYGIAERLAAEQNDVSVIDSSPKLIKAIGEQLDVRGFVGHGAHPDVLALAGAEEADMIIAVTLYDEVNMVACQVAHSLFNVPTKVARIRSQSYLQGRWQNLFSRDHMPIDVVISPEIEVGEMVLRRLALPGAVETIRFADDQVVAVGIMCEDDCPVVDTPLRQLTELFPDLSAVVVGIYRNNTLFVPKSSDSLLVGDLAYVVARRDQVRRTLGIFGHEEPEANRVVIAGGGNIGLYVARALETRQRNTKIKLIEASRDRAVAIADELKRSVILNGSALDQTILTEADVGDADTMVALTNEDEVNILASVMAKKLGCRRNLSLLNNPSYPAFASALGIDAFINPRRHHFENPSARAPRPYPGRPFAAERRRRGGGSRSPRHIAAGRTPVAGHRPAVRHPDRRGVPGRQGDHPQRRSSDRGEGPDRHLRHGQSRASGGADVQSEHRILLIISPSGD